jgi:hypothetical protein
MEEQGSGPNARLHSCEYVSAAEFFGAYDERGPTLLVPSEAQGVRAGERIAVEVRLAGRQDRVVVVRGVVTPFRPSDGVGFVVRVRDEDAARVRTAVELLHRDREPQRETRLATDDVPIRYEIPTGSFIGAVRDVSTGGCFIATLGPLPAPGGPVSLEVRPPGLLARRVRLLARCTWVDELDQSRGFGVRYEPDQPTTVEKFMFHVLVED